MDEEQKDTLLRIILASIILAVLHFLPTSGVIRFVLYMIPYYIVGKDTIKEAVKGIINLEPFDESLLMCVATVGAIILGLYNEAHSHAGDYVEAIAVMLFYQIGEFFQSIAVSKSKRNISELMDIRPDYANIEVDGQVKKVNPNEVKVGDIILIKAGEKVPLDGVVVEGKSTLDTKALTGESIPKEITTDDEIISGSINLTGLLRVQTTKVYSDSTVTKILELVENASERKSKSEDFITKFARVYTPCVVGGAVAIALLPPFIHILLNMPAMFNEWLYRGLIFLVISCPCALAVSIPMSFFAGIGGASRLGILIKGSNFLEMLSKVDTIVFDKTGTLTKGVFEVNAIHHSKIDEEKLVRLAAYAESASSHPIAVSLRTAYGKDIDITEVKEIQEISGEGIIAKVEGKEVATGNERLMKRLGVEPIQCHLGGTIIHIAIDGEYMGHIVISDRIKPESRTVVRDLRKAGIKNVVMLSGDIEKNARCVAGELGIEQVYAELLPEDKLDKIEEMMVGGNTVGFVGDGINDAPVITRADVGIAMGAMGSDAAIESADVVLMDDNPKKVITAVRLSRTCLNIVRENIVLAIGVKVLCLILGGMGLANMWLAVFADVGVLIICILNAIRMLFFRYEQKCVI